MREYLDVLDDAAFGGASEVDPKFTSHSDPANQWTAARKGEPLKQFRRNYSDPNRGPTGKGVATYQALKHTCKACLSKMKCCPSADTRKITREEHKDARQVACDIAKTKQYAVSMCLRSPAYSFRQNVDFYYILNKKS